MTGQTATLIMLICNAALMLLLWLILGRDEKPVITVETRPPDNLNPMQMEYLLTEQITDKSVFSMVIYWASKGIVDITKSKNLHVATVKNRFYRKDNKTPKHEKLLFKIIFNGRDYVVLENMPENLQHDWHIVESALKKEIGDIHTESSDDAHCCGLCVTSVIAGISIFLLTVEMHLILRIFFAVCSCCLIFFCIANNHLEALGYKVTFDRFTTPFFNICTLLIIMGMEYLLYLNHCELKIMIIFPVTVILSLVCLAFMGKRTNTKLYGRIIGFRDYIKLVEKNKMKELLKTNHKYALELLPYTILFNMGIGWSKKFEHADGFYGDNDWYVEEYMNELDNILESASIKDQ